MIEANQVQEPQLVFRVGITGARHIDPAQLARLRVELHRVFQRIHRRLEMLAPQERVQPFYAQTFEGQVTPVVRLISPLAIGADRLAAHEAINLGMELNVAMPFVQTVYEEDFMGSQAQSGGMAVTSTDDLAEFRELLEKAKHVVMLDGARDSAEWPGGDQFTGRSYEAVGHFVVHHCDLLVAIWDGNASRGRGGTAEIVEYSARAGVPVWWIHAEEDVPPAWISDRLDLRGDRVTAESPHKADAGERLDQHLGRLIPAPLATQPEEEGVLAWLAGLGRDRSLDQVEEYFCEVKRKERWVWGHHRRFVDWIAGAHSNRRPNSKSVAQAVRRCGSAQYWASWYESASQKAGTYTPRYRSAYTWVITLASMSLCAGALFSPAESVAGGHFQWAVAIFESILLIMILWLLVLSQRRDWHRRSIEYRLMAELFRQEQTLAELGWSLPIGGVEHLADREWLSWVAWLMAAAQRAAPFPPCATKHDGVIAVDDRPIRDLIYEQFQYHKDRARRSERTAGFLEKWGTRMFLLVVIVTLVEAALALFRPSGIHICRLLLGVSEKHLGHVFEGLEFVAAIATSISAASLAMRSYGELRLLVDQSKTMLTDLEHALSRLDRIAIERPLASQLVGEEAIAVALMLLRELEGWGRTFRGKLLETP